MSTAASSGTSQAKGRRKITIEEALRWAIRDEIPKKRHDAPIRGPAPPAMHAMWRAGIFGGPIDNWSREPGMPPAMGEPHPDALTIEAQFENLGIALELAANGSAPCPLDLSPYPIDTKLAGKANLDVLISTALLANRSWLATSAIHGKCPSVEGGPECEPQKSENGKITLWRTIQSPCGESADGTKLFTTYDTVATSKGDERDRGLFAKLVWTRSGVDVVEEQLRYAVWHAALVYLVPALQFLTSLEVLPPEAPPAPWIKPAPERAAPLPALHPVSNLECEDKIVPLAKTRPLRRGNLESRRPSGRRTVRRQGAPVLRGSGASETTYGREHA